MKAALLYGINDIKLENIDIPKVEPGEALVRIRAATTCGTDVKILRRGYVRGIIKYPTVFGHEWAGDIIKVGKGISWLQEGMRVRAGNSGPCLRCKMCIKGVYNLCENMTWLWGAYAEYIKIPASIVRINMQEIPSHLTYEEAAITEPLACCLHGIEKCNIDVDDTISIIGDGPISLLHLQLAKIMGARKIIMCGLVDSKLKTGSELGADITINVKAENPVKRVRELTEGYGVDVVIEAVGQPSTWVEAIKMAKKGGTILEFGGCPQGTKIRMSAERLHYDELTIMGSFHTTPSHFRKALSLIASGAVKIKPLITRRMSLDKINEAFQILVMAKDEIKIAIKP